MSGSTPSQGFIKKYKILVFAIIVLGAGITMVLMSARFLTTAQSCENYGDKNFFPETVIVTTCSISSLSGQELTFSAFFYSSAGNVAGGETIQLPAHLEIKDPNNVILYDLDFNDRMSIQFKPEAIGTYTATITNLQTEYHPIWKQTTYIVHSFGPTHNSLTAFGTIGAIGYLVIVFGVIFVIISAAKAAMKKKSSLISG